MLKKITEAKLSADNTTDINTGLQNTSSQKVFRLFIEVVIRNALGFLKSITLSMNRQNPLKVL